MIVKVGLLGASGRMGIEIASLLRDGFIQPGCALELADAIASSKRFKSIEGVPVRLVNEPAFDPVHIWIDFSQPEATLALLETIQTPLVIGTTGFSESQISKIHHYAEKHAVFLAPNMSPGINWIQSFLKKLPLPGRSAYQTVLSEIHHRHKRDSPSGTLKNLRQTLEESGYGQAITHAARAGDEKGYHEIRFISDDEEIFISHRVSSRAVFARGALMAAAFLVRQKKPGIFNFDSFDNRE